MKKNKSLTLFLSSFIGGALCLAFLYCLSDSLLFLLALKNGINPIWVVIVMILLFLLGSVYFFRLAKKNQKLYLPIAFLLLTFGLVNVGFYVYKAIGGSIIDSRGLHRDVQKEFFIVTYEQEGYMYLATLTGKEVEYNSVQSFQLFVKIIEGKRYYYCRKDNYYDVLHIVERYGEKKGKVNYPSSAFIITFDFDWDNLYVRNKETGNEDHAHNVTAQTSSESSSSRTSDEPQTIVVEHQRQPVPVQEWQPCGICRGARYCQTCGGNGWVYSASTASGRTECVVCRGSKECSACRGQGGQYITVYR